MTQHVRALGGDRRRARRRGRSRRGSARRAPPSPRRSRAQADLRRRLLAGDVERRAGRPRPGGRGPCSVSVDLPIPGEPPSSTSEPGDEAAAEHAVELADAGQQALGCARGLTSRSATTGAARAAAPRRRRRSPCRARSAAARPPRPACSTRRSPGTGRASGPRCARTAVQTWIVVAAAIGSSETRARGRRLRPPGDPALRRRSGSAAGPSPSRSVTRDQRLDDVGVELRAGVAAQLGDRASRGIAAAVGAVGRHRAEGVAGADDPRGERDLARRRRPSG